MEYIARLPAITGEPFEYVGHLTYGDHADIPRGHVQEITARRFRYFIGEINKCVYGKRWIRSGNGVWGAVATEKLIDYPHHHFIVGGAGLRANLRRLDMMNMWESTSKGWHRDGEPGVSGYARVTDYGGESAVRYLAKYVTKGGQVDVFAGARVRDRVEETFRMIVEARKLKA